MSKTSNSLLMLFYLNNKNTYTKISELSDYLEVSDREIRRYRDDLEKAGFFIENKTGRYGGYRLVTDIVLMMNINHMKHVLSYYKENDVRLTDVIQRRMINILEDLKTDKYIASHLLSHDMIEKLIKINLAMNLKYKLEINYLLSDYRVVNQLIEPYMLKNIRNRQYLFALNSGKLKSYRVSNIDHIEQTELPYMIDHNIYEKEKNESAYGVYRTDTKHTVVFRVYGKMNAFVHDIFNGKYRCLEEKDKYSTYTLETYSLHECLYTFLSFGSSLKIISPQEMKDIYHKEINKMKKNV